MAFGSDSTDNKILNGQMTNQLARFNRQGTNLIEAVEWQILTGLESTLDIQCALFILSIRYHENDKIDKDYWKQRLDSADLGEDNFCDVFFELFDKFYRFQREEGSYTNAQREVSLAISRRSERLYDDFRRRARPFQNGPLTLNDGSLENPVDIMGALSTDEKKTFILIYTFFKKEFFHVYSKYFAQDKQADRFFRKSELDWYESKAFNSQPTTSEIEFLLALYKDMGLGK